MKIVYALIVVLALAFALYTELKADAREKRAEKKEREAAENGERIADKITEANKIKQNANTGNFDNDFNYIAGKLHEYAKK